MSNRRQIRKGWEDAGRKCTVLGEDVEVNGMSWTPIVFDDEEDPDWHKSSSLEEIKEPSHTQQEPERASVTNLVGLKSSNCIEVYFNKNVDDFKDKFPYIKEAIDKVLNEPLPPKPQVLFTTEDGVEYMEGEKKEVWGVHTKDGYNSVGAYHPDLHYECYPQLLVHYEYFFSTEEKADEWVLMNKPCLSLNDIKWWIEDYFDYPGGISVEQLKELAKQKQPTT